MLISKRYLWVVVCVVIGIQARAQVANSPFTKFGIGENYTDALANTQGMAGVGVSHPQYWYVNNQNPALLVYNMFTTFQVGIIGESQKISSGSVTEKNVGGNLNYLVTAFPVKRNKWTTSIGLMPYTSMNYKVKFTKPVDGTNLSSNGEENGTGGLTQLYWSNGVRIYKDFSLGLKATYLFGAVDKIYKFQPIQTGASTLISASEDKTVVNDFTFSLGGSYSKDSLIGPLRVSVGAVYGLATNAKAKLINKISNITVAGDTLTSTNRGKSYGRLNIPPSITGGFSISKGSRWMLGTQFSYQNWSSFRDVANTNQNLQKSWSIGLGGEYTPDATAVDGFFKRVTYRLGASIEKTPLLAPSTENGKPVKDTGINFGFSVPTGRSSIDVGFKIGKRGNKADNMLEQNYFKIFFGITFNDQWFIRRKFD
jgi:hypothetical protein